MTAIWGPLGWLTLHSISVNYPEIPKAEDKAIVKKFLDLLAETISCPSCKGHFTSIYHTYTSHNVNWADSRYNLYLFVVRAHNTVNKRLDKPRPSTVAESLTMLQMATKLKKPSEYRNSYIKYLMNNWSREGGGEGMIQMGNVRAMQKINEQYWNLRETEFDKVWFPESDILTPIVSSPRFERAYYLPIPQPTVGGSALHITKPKQQPSIGLKFKSGRFSLGK
jgi:hypothetical protein